MNSNTNSNNNSNITYDDDENEDEIKRYLDKDGHSTIIVVFEGNYVRFAKELDKKEGKKLAEEKIVSIDEFKKMIKEEGWSKQKEDDKIK
jgi:hypothetical protein